MPDHEAFRNIIDKSIVAAPSPHEQQSLDAHLHNCTSCSDYLAAGARAASSLSGFSFEVDPALNSKVLASLTLRVQQLEVARPTRARLLACLTLALTLTAAGSFAASRVALPLAAALHLHPAQLNHELLTLWVLPSLWVSLLLPILPLISQQRADQKGNTL